MPAFLAYLRAATQPHHARLDAAPLSARVTDGTLDPDDYRALVAWQHRAHAVAEAGLGDFPWPTEYRYAPRLPVLAAEAATLALPTPRVAALPPAVSLAAAAGRAYVLEGSSLGGNMILGHLRGNARLTGLSDFAFYGFQRGLGLRQWRSFTAFAKTRNWTPAEAKEASAEAAVVFGVFARALPEERVD